MADETLTTINPDDAEIVAAREAALEKTAILIESLSWLGSFRDKVVVVKFGGNAMVSPELQRTFAEDILYLHHVGLKPVVVHGGGPQISSMLDKLGIHSEFKGGYRVTTPEAMDVVRMVLTGHINRGIVRSLNELNPTIAIGMSGEDAGLFTGRKRGAMVDGEIVDLGLVGDVVAVNPDVILTQLEAGRIPVVSSVAPDGDVPGQSLNVNADAAAAALAVALHAEKLIILTDVAGLYRDWPDRASMLTSIPAGELHALLPSLESGMIPKMSACLDAVQGGVPKAAIVDGRIPHSILLEIFTQQGIGTEVTA